MIARYQVYLYSDIKIIVVLLTEKEVVVGVGVEVGVG
jgi:hypothetical protein